MAPANGQLLQRLVGIGAHPSTGAVFPAAATSVPSFSGATNPSPLGSAYDEVRIPLSFQLLPTTATSDLHPAVGAAVPSSSISQPLLHPLQTAPARESAFVSVPIVAPIAAAPVPATAAFATNGLPSAHQSVPLPASFHMQGGAGGHSNALAAPSTPVPYASPSPSHAAAANLPHLLIPGSPALPAFPLAGVGHVTPSSPAAPNGNGNGGPSHSYAYPSASAPDAAPVTGVSMNSKQWAQLLYRYRAGDTPTPGSGASGASPAAALAAARAGLATPSSPSLLHSESLSTPPLHSPNALGARPSSRTRSRQMNRKVSEVDQVASAHAAASAATPSLTPQPQPQLPQPQQQQQPVMDAEKFAMQNELNRLRAVIAMQTHAAASQQLQQQPQSQQHQSTPQHFPSPQLSHHQQQHLAHLYAPSPTPSPSSGPGLSWNTAFAAMSNSMSMQNLAVASAAAATASPSPQPLAMHASEQQQQQHPVFSSLPSPMIALIADVNASQQDHRSTFRSMSMLIRSGSAAQHHQSQLHLHAPSHHMQSAVPSMGSLVRSRSAEDSAHFSLGVSPAGPPFVQQHSALSVLVGSTAAAAVQHPAAGVAAPRRPSTTIVTEIEEEEPLSTRATVDDDAPDQAEIEADGDSAELDAMTEVADFLARNDAPVNVPQRKELVVAEEEAQLQGLNDQPAVTAAAPKDASSNPTSPSSAAATKATPATPSSLVAPSSAGRVAIPGSRKSPRSGPCTNPSCAERLASQRTELQKLLSAKTSEEKDTVDRVSRAAEQRLTRELAAKDVRIAALEKTQRKLLASSGGAAKVLQAQVDELQSMVARLRSQVESLGAVPVVAQATVAATSADASTATSSDEPDVTSVPEVSPASAFSMHGCRTAITVDAGSDSSCAAVHHQPASPLPHLQQQDQPFFNTSAPRTVQSKAGKGNTRRRSASFGSGARLHTVAAAAAASAHAAATTAVAPSASSSSSAATSKVAESAHTGRSDAKAPSRPMASNPQSGQPIRARANSLRTAAEASSTSTAAAGPPLFSGGIHASLQAASPSRSGAVRKNSRSRPNNAPGTPGTPGTAAAATSGGGLSVNGTAVDSGTPKQQRPSLSMNVRPQPQSHLPPSGASASSAAAHASASDGLPSSLSPTASQLTSSRDHSPGSLTLPSALAGED